jgi:decaprenylphospho-beta-D-erythro-pentofuranosid-2-ulose 2-reductase
MPEILSPVLIVGARAGIGRALARAYAAEGCSIILAARGTADLGDDKTDLELRHGVKVSTADYDVVTGDPDRFFAELGEVPGTMIMVAGMLGDQDASLREDEEARAVLETNFAGPARFMLAAARVMTKPGSTLIGIGSVAGDRGRGSNLVYGSAKAGFAAFLSGLRNKLQPSGVHVMTVKPGFVRTAMTAGMKLPPLITAEPEAVAKAVVSAHKRGRNEIYVKLIWWPIMQVIKAIPEPLFKRLKL